MSLEEIAESRKTALTVAEVAALLNVSGRLVYQLVSIGEIPHFRVGNAVRFEPKSLSVWLHEKMKAAGKQRKLSVFGKCDESLFAKAVMTELWSKVLLPKRRS